MLYDIWSPESFCVALNVLHLFTFTDAWKVAYMWEPVLGDLSLSCYQWALEDGPWSSSCVLLVNISWRGCPVVVQTGSNTPKHTIVREVFSGICSIQCGTFKYHHHIIICLPATPLYQHRLLIGWLQSHQSRQSPSLPAFQKSKQRRWIHCVKLVLLLVWIHHFLWTHYPLWSLLTCH